MSVFAASFTVGSKMRLSEEESKTFVDEFNKLLDTMKGGNFSVEIFSHNAQIALPMFLPGAGIGWGVFSAFSTGLAVSALQINNPMLTKIPSLAILVTPFGLIELASYSIGMSRSLILISKIVRKSLTRQDIKFAMVEVGLVVGFLLLAAFIEVQMIESGAGLAESNLEN